MRKKKRIAVVGAGIGGLSAGAILSRRSDVRIYEKANYVGGKVNQLHVAGRPIDSGPTVFTMRTIFDSIFQQAGASLDNCARIDPMETLASHYWSDGSRLDLHADFQRTTDAIASFAGESDAKAFREFHRDARDVFALLEEKFLRREAPSLPALMVRPNPFALFKLDPYNTYWRRLSKTFESPRLRQIYARYATYCGCSPLQAPATLMLIAHIEQRGVWTVDGGISRIAEQLAATATKNGAELSLSDDVQSIRSLGSEIEITSASGRRTYDAVVFNGDVAALADGHYGSAPAKTVQSRAARDRTQSAITWTTLAKTSGVNLSVHNVFFSDDYESEFADVFEKGRPPRNPTVYVYAPDRADGAPPSGEERLFILINAPANGDTHDYVEEEINACRVRTFEHLHRCGLTVTASLETSIVQTPTLFDQRYPGTGGALFGSTNHGWRASFKRQGVRSRLKGLYFAGGSVHPGSGVPMAALSGEMAAKAIIKDYALT